MQIDIMQTDIFNLPWKMDGTKIGMTKGQQVYRMTFGAKMPSGYSRIYPKELLSYNVNVETGSIGFMDLIDKRIDKPAFLKSSRLRTLDTISVMIVGIEPDYQHGKYFGMMHNELLQLAKKEHKNATMFEGIPDPKFREMLVKEYEYVGITDKEVLRLLKK
jgi:hypothetical protein